MVWLMLFASALVGVIGSDDSAEDRDVEGYVSDREVPRDVPTLPDQASKGHWATGALPGGKTVDLGFVPQKVYTQVRKYDTVKHLPSSAAAAEATTYEEKINAPRLREVLSEKKIQQVYEEEGYEDMGYDHGGYNHHGAKYEDREKNEDLSLKKPKHDNDPGSAEHVAVIAGKFKNATAKSGSTPVAVRWKRFHTETQTRRMSFGDDSGDGRTKSVVEEIEDTTRPFVKDREAVTVKSDLNGTVGDGDSVGAASVPEEITIEKVTGDTSVEAREGGLNLDKLEAADYYSSHSTYEEPSGRSLEARVINDPRPKGSNVVTFPGRHTRRQYAMERPVDVYVQESVGYGVRRPVYGLPVTPVTANVHHYLPYMPAFPSYYSDNPPTYTAPVISQRHPVKQVVIEASTMIPPSVVPVLDTGPIKFLNAADTLNAYASLLKQAATTPAPKPVQEIEQNYADLIQPRFNSSLDVDISASTRMENHKNATSTTRRRPSKFRYPVSNGRGRLYNNFTRSGNSFSNYSGPSGKGNMELKNPTPHTRHPSLPRDSSEDASNDTPYAAAQSLPLHQKPHRPQDPVKYIESLTVAHFANGANVPKSPPSEQNERLRELARQLNAHSDNISRRKRLGISRNKRNAGEIEYDQEKYPFYDSYKGISRDSALRYASNPDDIPKKSPGGMEFYESKDSLVKCDEPGGPGEVVPERDEDGEWNDKPQPENLRRMKGLGDSIDCLKLRYFGRDPLDNPFFKEGPIGEPQMYEVDKSIKNHVSNLDRKVRDVDKRVMIIPPREDNSSHNVYNHNYTTSENIRGGERVNGHSSFPYKNHKPEFAEVSASVHNLRAHSPYKYYSEQDNSYFPNYEPHHDSETEDSEKHKYYHHNYKHKYAHKKKKRTRPPYQSFYPRPLPVSIYSVIAASKTYPLIRRPIIYPSGSHVVPMYQQVDGGQLNDNHVSDSKTSYQTTPTRWYVVRPGEYTENKDIATDSKTSSSSIWNYINPLRWWFPAYFDERRGEPKHRRRRSSIPQQEQELFNRILARTNNATFQSRIVDNYKTSSPDMMRNHQESSTGQPISINEFKARMNATSERLSKTQSKLNRLTGGFISRNSVTTSTPSYTNTISSPSYGEELYGVVIPSTSPMTPSSGEFNPTVSTTSKPKVLFPRTRTPARRRPQSTKSNLNSVSRNSLTTATSTTTTTTTPSTTTRMYKPKRIEKKKFDKKMEVFPVLRRSNKPAASTPSPFDSVESSVVESGSMEEPRRLQQVEHRRVTKEEVYKTSYIPEEEARTNRNVEDSVESYSMSSSESSPVTGPTMDPENHTLTYMVNPVTGVGSWGEQPRRTTWRPKRKYPKRHLEGKSGYRSTFRYPSVIYSSGGVEQETSTSNRNRKRHSGVPHYDSQAYIAVLMNQVHPKSDVSRAPRRGSHRKSSASTSDEDFRSYGNNGSGAESGSEENQPPPTKSPPKFILDPGKRKYFYVRNR